MAGVKFWCEACEKKTEHTSGIAEDRYNVYVCPCGRIEDKEMADVRIEHFAAIDARSKVAHH